MCWHWLHWIYPLKPRWTIWRVCGKCGRTEEWDGRWWYMNFDKWSEEVGKYLPEKEINIEEYNISKAKTLEWLKERKK